MEISGTFIPLGLLILFVIWTLIWKGFALWRAARDNEKGWFVVLLIINTCGLLEMFYLFLRPRFRK